MNNAYVKVEIIREVGGIRYLLYVRREVCDNNFENESALMKISLADFVVDTRNSC